MRVVAAVSPCGGAGGGHPRQVFHHRRLRWNLRVRVRSVRGEDWVVVPESGVHDLGFRVQVFGVRV